MAPTLLVAAWILLVMSSIVVDTKQSIPVHSSCVPTVSTFRYLLDAAPYSEPMIGPWGMKCEWQLLRSFGHAPERFNGWS